MIHSPAELVAIVKLKVHSYKTQKINKYTCCCTHCIALGKHMQVVVDRAAATAAFF